MTLNAFPSRRDLMITAATLAAAAPARGLTAKDDTAPTPRRERSRETVKGVVFESRTSGRERQKGDPGTWRRARF